MADTTGTSWSDIPLDLASRILCRLPAHVDRVRFGAVCPQWRAATRHGPLSPPLPLLLLSDARVYSLPGSKKFHCPGFKGFTDACGDWLVFSGEEGYFLRDPWSNATVTLPPLTRVRTRLVRTDGGPVWSRAPDPDPRWKRIFTRRGRDGGVVLNDLATQAWMEMAETLQLKKKKPKTCKLWLCSSNLIVAAIKFWRSQRIAVCQPGATSWWSVCVENICSNFVDTAFHQGKLYAIDTMATIFAIDVSVDQSSGEPWISQIRKVIDSPCLDMPSVLVEMHYMAYLVESRGVLLVVLRRLRHPLMGHDDRFEFEVFEADLNHSRCFKVTAIGNNEVLFLRRRCSRSLCVPPNGFPGGCICFVVNDEINSRHCYDGKNYCRVYSMTDGKVSNPLPTVSWFARTVSGTWLFPRAEVKLLLS